MKSLTKMDLFLFLNMHIDKSETQSNWVQSNWVSFQKGKPQVLVWTCTVRCVALRFFFLLTVYQVDWLAGHSEQIRAEEGVLSGEFLLHIGTFWLTDNDAVSLYPN